MEPFETPHTKRTDTPEQREARMKKYLKEMREAGERTQEIFESSDVSDKNLKIWKKMIGEEDSSAPPTVRTHDRPPDTVPPGPIDIKPLKQKTLSHINEWKTMAPKAATHDELGEILDFLMDIEWRKNSDSDINDLKRIQELMQAFFNRDELTPEQIVYLEELIREHSSAP